MSQIKWLQDNYLEMIQALTLMVVAAEIVTRITPTKTDDGFVKRIGVLLDKVLNLLGVPNLRRQIKERSRIDDGDDFEMARDAGGDIGPRVPARTQEQGQRGESE